MATESEKLPLLKNYATIFDSNSLTDAVRRDLHQPDLIYPPYPVPIAEITFDEVNKNIEKKLFGQSEEFDAVKDILEHYTTNDPNRMFASVRLQKEYGKSGWYLNYSAQYNQNFLVSLRSTVFSKMQVLLRCFMEVNQLGKWCPWIEPESKYNFEILLQNIQGTMSDELSVRSNGVALIEDSAINWILQGKENLRVRYAVDIFLVRDPALPLLKKTQIQPNSMKLADHSVLQALYENDETKDIRIIVGDDVELKVHKCILTAHSDVFKAMVASKMKEENSGIIRIDDISEAVMRELIPYFYGMEIPALELNCETAMELFQTAHKYKLKELEHAAISLFLFRDEKWFTAETALELYYFTRNMPNSKTLNDYLLKILSRFSSDELRKSEKFRELSSSDVLDLTFKLNDILRVD